MILPKTALLGRYAKVIYQKRGISIIPVTRFQHQKPSFSRRFQSTLNNNSTTTADNKHGNVGHNHVSVLQASPFTYETLKSRLEKHSKSSTESHREQFYEELLIDAIQSCRKLEQKLIAENQSLISSNQIDNSALNELLSKEGKEKTRIKKVDEVEKLLQQFLFENKNPKINNVILNLNANVLKSYFVVLPKPNSDQIINTISTLNKLTAEKLTNSEIPFNEDCIKVALRVILNSDKLSPTTNFQNSFKLVNETFGSPRYIESIKSKVFTKYIPRYVAGFIGIEVAAGFIFDRFAVEFIGISASSTTGLKLMLGSYLFNASLLGIIALLGFFSSRTLRVKWRTGVNLWHKFLHQKELVSYEKIFNHYEEMYDLNVDNYHLIGGNRLKAPNVTSNLALANGSGTAHTNGTVNGEIAPAAKEGEGFKSLLNYSDSNNDNISYEFPSESSAGSNLNFEFLQEKKKLLAFFRENFRKKRMQIGEYTEPELLFQEYWASNGENFEWVEPDQDPAEIKLLQKYHVNK